MIYESYQWKLYEFDKMLKILFSINNEIYKILNLNSLRIKRKHTKMYGPKIRYFSLKGIHLNINYKISSWNWLLTNDYFFKNIALFSSLWIDYIKSLLPISSTYMCENISSLNVIETKHRNNLDIHYPLWIPLSSI